MEWDRLLGEAFSDLLTDLVACSSIISSINSDSSHNGRKDENSLSFFESLRAYRKFDLAECAIPKGAHDTYR